MESTRTPLQKIGLVLFALLFAAWTFALEMHVPEKVTETIGSTWSFIVAKSLHLGVFAFEMVLGLLCIGTYRGRWIVAAALSLQAALSELFQYLLNEWFHRHGCIKDVLIDHLGLLIGFIIYCGIRSAAKKQRNTDSEKVSTAGPV